MNTDNGEAYLTNASAAGDAGQTFVLGGVLFRGDDGDPQTLEELLGDVAALGASCHDPAMVRAGVKEGVAWIQARFATVPPDTAKPHTWADAQVEPGATSWPT